MLYQKNYIIDNSSQINNLILITRNNILQSSNYQSNILIKELYIKKKLKNKFKRFRNKYRNKYSYIYYSFYRPNKFNLII